jgi:GntR family transcriptional regulator
MTTVRLNDHLAPALNSQPLRTPRFQKIADQLRADIIAGRWPEHASLPSERGISEQLGVSRMTARRALEALEQEGLVYSEDRRGRFVSPQRLTYNVSNRVSFIAEAQARGMDLEIDVIETRESAADAKLVAQLALTLGDLVYEYTRLFRSKGHPIFIETETVIARRFPDFLDHDLRQSTTRILEMHYATSAKIGDIVIRMRRVQENEARLLGLTTRHAGIELEQIIRDDTGTPFCVGRQLWRGELAEFTARAIVNQDILS